MDIHLADGSSFEIFEHVRITAPIIFTTAYDEYALKAFKVNSVDYLLKPIGPADLRQALAKLEELHHAPESRDSLPELIRTLQKRGRYKTHFLIPSKGGQAPAAGRRSGTVFLHQRGCYPRRVSSRESYVLPCTLDELTESLDPERFFRVNRQYLISRGAVQDIDLWFNNRLAINLRIPTGGEGRILVSKLRVNEFKNWFSGY